MKTRQTIILLLVTLAFSLPAADSTNRLHFPVCGFSIAPLDASPGEKTGQALMMSLPATGNFAGNVNVQVQPYSGTIEEYTTLTLKQFKDLGIKLISQKKAGTSVVVFEYSGERRDRVLHWYARAEKRADHVYLATATAAEEDWPRQGTQLKICVDSLRCEPGGAANRSQPGRPETNQPSAAAGSGR